eukprot:5271107-Heterocapsa_arctica.AAC.1
MLTKIVAGGLWPNQRLHEAGLVESPYCDLCNSGQVQDESHLMWSCSCVGQQKAMRELDDEALVRVAAARAREHPTFWTRGLAPSNALCVPPPPEVQEFCALPAEPWAPGAYFTDASGGRLARDNLLRRVGFAAIQLQVALLDPQGRLVCEPQRFLGGPLAGPRQTVNRGELQAVISLLQHICPSVGDWTTVYSDS